MTILANSASILSMTALLTGCVSMGVQVQQDQLSGFKKGVTTEAEVVGRLGGPNTSMISSDGNKTIIYTYVQAQARPASFIPIVGLFAGGSDTQVNSTTFLFDANGKMISYNSTETKYGTGMGFASGRPVDQADQPRQAPEKQSSP